MWRGRLATTAIARREVISPRSPIWMPLSASTGWISAQNDRRVFGGMSLAAGLSSYIILTPEARLGLNGAEVIEQESGIEEFDSSDRALIWRSMAVNSASAWEWGTSS